MRVVLTGPRSADIDGRLLLDPPVRDVPADPAAAPRTRPGHWRDPSAPTDGPSRQAVPAALVLHTAPGPGRDRPWTGDRRHLAGLVVLALPAGLPDGGPDPERVCLLVTDEAGARMLWAPLPGRLPQATLSALRGLHLDLVFLGAPEGPADGPRGLSGMSGSVSSSGDDSAPTCETGVPGHALLYEVARLREVGAVDARTQVAILPPAPAAPAAPARPWTDDAAASLPSGPARLPWALQVSGAVIAAVPGASYRTPAGGDIPAVPGRATGRRVLVLGPAAGGKSAYAEALVAADPHVTYLATGPAPSPDDTEWTDRVDRHRRRRPSWWATAEAPDTTTVATVLAESTGTVLWDSAGSWLAGVLERHDAWTGAGGWRDAVDAEVEQLMAALLACQGRVVIVSEEVGWGVVPATASGRLFRDLLGALNQRLAWDCDDVLLVVAGRAMPMPPAPGAVVVSSLPASPVAVIAESVASSGPLPAPVASAGPLL